MVNLRKTSTIALLVATLMGTTIPFAYAMEGVEDEGITKASLARLPFTGIMVEPDSQEAPKRPLSLVVSIQKEGLAFNSVSSQEGKEMLELLMNSYHSLPEDVQPTKFSRIKFIANNIRALRIKEKDENYEQNRLARLLDSNETNEKIQFMLGVYTNAYMKEEEAREKALAVELRRKSEQEKSKLEAEIARQQQELAILQEKIAAEKAAAEEEEAKQKAIAQQRQFEQEKAELEAETARQQEEALKIKQQEEIVRQQQELALLQAKLSEEKAAAEEEEAKQKAIAQQRQFEQEKAKLEAELARQEEETLKLKQQQELAELQAKIAAQRAAAEEEQAKLRQMQEETTRQAALLEQQRREAEAARQRAATANTHQTQAVLTEVVGKKLAKGITGGRSDKRIERNLKNLFK